MNKWLVSAGRARIMGIVNVTPDSFSDGDQFLSHEQAIAHGRALSEAGADIVDVGGESTRPGSIVVSVEEEIRRAIPVVRALAKDGIPVSIDTSKPAVMEAAVNEGACLINDVYALRREGAMDMAARLAVPVCLMHMQGTPDTMQIEPTYRDVVQEVHDFLSARVTKCVQKGIGPDQIIVDPGFGFGKTKAHNLTLMKSLDKFLDLSASLMVGISRKAFIRTISGFEKGVELDQASAVVAGIAVKHGAGVLRVHDVASTVSMLRLFDSLDLVNFSERLTVD